MKLKNSKLGEPAKLVFFFFIFCSFISRIGKRHKIHFTFILMQFPLINQCPLVANLPTEGVWESCMN